MRIAVLGLGRMGTAIAERLEQAGHELSVWNRSPTAVEPFKERSIRSLDHPADAWRHADCVVTMLADGPAVEAVILGEHGLLESSDGGVIVDMSTISAAASASVAAGCARRGVAFLRAPVTGNPSVVRAGNLGIIVSGPRDEFGRLVPTLRDIGPSVFYVGPQEEARIVKLALNLMIAGTAELMAEALVLAQKHGIGSAQMLEVMGASAVGSPFVKYKTDALIAEDYSSTFTSRQMYKDLALALEAAEAAELPLPVTALTQHLVLGCVGSDMDDWDFTALLPRLRREAGL